MKENNNAIDSPSILKLMRTACGVMFSGLAMLTSILLAPFKVAAKAVWAKRPSLKVSLISTFAALTLWGAAVTVIGYMDTPTGESIRYYQAQVNAAADRGDYSAVYSNSWKAVTLQEQPDWFSRTGNAISSWFSWTK